MSITTVVFDFGNVLGFFSHRQAGEQLAAYTSLSAEFIQGYLFGGQLEDDYEAGRITSAVFRGMARETCRLHCTDDQFDRAYADMFTPNPDVCALVPRLRPHHRLLLLSNTTEVHAAHFCRQFETTLGHLDHLVLSFRVGLRKPDPRIYQYAQNLAGAPPGECLFIDDLPTNVEAARACGWQGLVYRRGDDLAARLAGLGVRLAPPA